MPEPPSQEGPRVPRRAGLTLCAPLSPCCDSVSLPEDSYTTSHLLLAVGGEAVRKHPLLEVGKWGRGKICQHSSCRQQHGATRVSLAAFPPVGAAPVQGGMLPPLLGRTCCREAKAGRDQEQTPPGTLSAAVPLGRCHWQGGWCCSAGAGVPGCVTVMDGVMSHSRGGSPASDPGGLSWHCPVLGFTAGLSNSELFPPIC